MLASGTPAVLLAVSGLAPLAITFSLVLAAVLHTMRLHPPDLPNSEIYRFIVLVNTPTELLTCHSPIPYTRPYEHLPDGGPESGLRSKFLQL